MRKLIFSMTAAAAFLLTIGGTAVAKSLMADTIWVYNNNGDSTLETPKCSSSENTCATLHEYFPGAPEGQQIGDPVIVDGEKITRKGDRLP